MWTKSEIKEIRESATISASGHGATLEWVGLCHEMAAVCCRIEEMIDAVDAGRKRAQTSTSHLGEKE